MTLSYDIFIAITMDQAEKMRNPDHTFNLDSIPY